MKAPAHSFGKSVRMSKQIIFPSHIPFFRFCTPFERNLSHEKRLSMVWRTIPPLQSTLRDRQHADPPSLRWFPKADAGRSRQSPALGRVPLRHETRRRVRERCWERSAFGRVLNNSQIACGNMLAETGHNGCSTTQGADQFAIYLPRRREASILLKSTNRLASFRSHNTVDAAAIVPLPRECCLDRSGRG